MQAVQITEMLNKDKLDQDMWNHILPIVYNQLKVIARNVKFGHKLDENLNTTSLVHEAYLKLQKHGSLTIEGTNHFYRLASCAMRQIVIDVARSNLRNKRSDESKEAYHQDLLIEINHKSTSSTQLLAIDKALENLEELNPRLAEIVINHYYGGYTFEQIGKLLNISKRTALRDWKKAKSFIYCQLS